MNESRLNLHAASPNALMRRLASIIHTSHGSRRAVFVGPDGNIATCAPSGTSDMPPRYRLAGVYDTVSATFSARRMWEDIQLTLNQTWANRHLQT